MATLTLGKLWINVFATGEAVSGYSADRGEELDLEGGVRTYAGGRRRAYTVAGDIGSFDFTIRDVTKANVDLLKSWRGILVQVRDHRGQRFVGIFRKVKPVEVKADINLYDVQLQLETVSFVDGV